MRKHTVSETTPSPSIDGRPARPADPVLIALMIAVVLCAIGPRVYRAIVGGK